MLCQVNSPKNKIYKVNAYHARIYTVQFISADRFGLKRCIVVYFQSFLIAFQQNSHFKMSYINSTTR